MSAWADQSGEVNDLAKSFVKASGELKDLLRTRTADIGQYSYSYADLASVLAMARPVLASNGLAITQTAESNDTEVVVWTVLLHESGQYVCAQPVRLPVGKTAQNTGSALSYARRYAIMALLNLASEDDDGAQASPRDAGSAGTKKIVKAVRGDSKGQSVASRSTEESKIREIMVDLEPARLKEVRAGFVEEFGCGLSDLDTSRHAEALRWVLSFAE